MNSIEKLSKRKKESSMTHQKFECEICSKLFKAKKSLQDHVMIHNGDKNYKCTFDTCNKSFVQFSCLQKHLRIHNGDKPYNCSVCNRNFTQLSNLNRHKKIHANEKPFTCNICAKNFTTSSNLKQHLPTHKSKELRKCFLCQVCEKNFVCVETLKKHMKSKHEQNLKSFKEKMTLLNDNLFIIKHKDHLDVLKNGFLFQYDIESKHLSLSGHILEESEDNRSTCNPFDEFSHITSYKQLGQIYKEISQKKPEKINYEMLLAIENCNSFVCKCPSCGVCRKSKNGQLIPNNMENCSDISHHKKMLLSLEKEKNNEKTCCSKKNIIDKVKKSCCSHDQKQKIECEEKNKYFCGEKKEVESNPSSCFCKETKEYHHIHRLICGHPFITHFDHIDYIVDGNLHFPHDGHCDNHGKIYIYGSGA